MCMTHWCIHENVRFLVLKSSHHILTASSEIKLWSLLNSTDSLALQIDLNWIQTIPDSRKQFAFYAELQANPYNFSEGKQTSLQGWILKKLTKYKEIKMPLSFHYFLKCMTPSFGHFTKHCCSALEWDRHRMKYTFNNSNSTYNLKTRDPLTI